MLPKLRILKKKKYIYTDMHIPGYRYPYFLIPRVHVCIIFKKNNTGMYPGYPGMFG